VATPAITDDLAHLVDDPNLSIRLIAARFLLPIPSRQAAALAVVTQALASESPSHRRAALRMVESMDIEIAELRTVLRQQMALETDSTLRDDMIRVLERRQATAAVDSRPPTPVLAASDVILTGALK
jgi:hypothetical protein